jgi:ABC-type amino acid transport substrate-binding protein
MLTESEKFSRRNVVKARSLLFMVSFMVLWMVPAFSVAAEIDLTPDEKAWVRENHSIRVHNEKSWPPFNFSENGKPSGFSIDYMNLVASKVGLQIKYVTGPSWNEFLGMMKSGDLDVMLNIVQTPDRLKYLLYTIPYVSNPNAILSRSDKPFNRLEDLVGKTVSMPKGFFQEEILRRDYPKVKLHLVKNMREAMKAVAFGQADAAVGEATVFNYFIKHDMMTGLAISGELKMGIEDLDKLWIATRKDLPLLRSILTKAMGTVTQDERIKLINRWIGSEARERKRPTAKSAAQTSISTEVNKTEIFILILFVSLLAMFAIIALVLSRLTQNKDVSTFFGKRGFRVTVMIGLSVLVALVALMNWLAISDNKRNSIAAIGQELQIVLHS